MGKNRQRGALQAHRSMETMTYRSRLKKWNATYKVCFSMAALFTVLIGNDVWLSLLTILYMGWLSCGIGKIKGRDYLRCMLIPLSFLALSCLAMAVQYGANTDRLAGMMLGTQTLYVTRAGLCLAGSLFLKSLAAISCMFLMSLSTPMGELLYVLGRLRIPGTLLALMHFIYRYIFILLETNRRQKEAIMSRLGYENPHNRLRVFGSEVANLLVVSMKRSQEYYDALQSRGYEGGCIFWEEKRAFGSRQLIWGIGYAMLAILLLLARRGH